MIKNVIKKALKIEDSTYHLILTAGWSVVLILAIAGMVLKAKGYAIAWLLFLVSVAFISLCSIYANMAGHWSAYEAAKAKEENQSDKG